MKGQVQQSIDAAYRRHQEDEETPLNKDHKKRIDSRHLLRKHDHAIFHGCKNVHFQMKIFNIFLIFAQNIDCEAVLTSTHNQCFRAK